MEVGGAVEDQDPPAVEALLLRLVPETTWTGSLGTNQWTSLSPFGELSHSPLYRFCCPILQAACRLLSGALAA